MVIPTALLFNFVYVRLHGHPFLDEHAAEHTIESFHPLHSGTIFFAALTGVLLWLSSLGAGWLENWVTYRRLPEAIASHRLGRDLRPRHDALDRAQAAAQRRRHRRQRRHRLPPRHDAGDRQVLRHPARGAPRDAVDRLAGARRLHARASARRTCCAAVVGIVIMLALNFGVSFACALFVALRARGISHAGRRLLRAPSSLRFVREPLPLLPAGRPATLDCRPSARAAPRIHHY